MSTPDVVGTLDAQLDGQRNLGKKLQRPPEPSLQEHQPADRVESEVTGLGYTVQRIGGTGVVGVPVNGTGTTGSTAGPVLSARDSLKITVSVLRLQTIVSRKIAPGKFTVVTAGASSAGAKSNIIPDRAELLLNLRTYDEWIRTHTLEPIERIVRGECTTAGSPKGTGV